MDAHAGDWIVNKGNVAWILCVVEMIVFGILAIEPK